jgi:hypothetical protein
MSGAFGQFINMPSMEEYIKANSKGMDGLSHGLGGLARLTALGLDQWHQRSLAKRLADNEAADKTDRGRRDDRMFGILERRETREAERQAAEDARSGRTLTIEEQNAAAGRKLQEERLGMEREAATYGRKVADELRAIHIEGAKQGLTLAQLNAEMRKRLDELQIRKDTDALDLAQRLQARDDDEYEAGAPIRNAERGLKLRSVQARSQVADQIAGFDTPGGGIGGSLFNVGQGGQGSPGGGMVGGSLSGPPGTGGQPGQPFDLESALSQVAALGSLESGDLAGLKDLIESEQRRPITRRDRRTELNEANMESIGKALGPTVAAKIDNLVGIYGNKRTVHNWAGHNEQTAKIINSIMQEVKARKLGISEAEVREYVKQKLAGPVNAHRSWTLTDQQDASNAEEYLNSIYNGPNR